jgi:methionine-rich copper-binding protein CopC
MRVLAAVALSVVLFSVALPAFAQSAPAFPTTAVTTSGIQQATIGPSKGVLVNYTSSLTSPLTAFVYLDLVNSAGQTVYVNIASCNLQQGQLAQCFVSLSSSIPAGAYTAKLFAVTTDSVPVSTTGTLQVTI